MFCTNCGKEIQPGERFCMNCGMPVMTAVNPKPKPAPDPRDETGQTSEKTKLKFGAELQRKYFYAHHSNPFLNLFAMVGKHMLEYKYEFPEYHVFKEHS